jgi:hypothetical protein
LLLAIALLMFSMGLPMDNSDNVVRMRRSAHLKYINAGS